MRRLPGIGPKATLRKQCEITEIISNSQVEALDQREPRHLQSDFNIQSQTFPAPLEVLSSSQRTLFDNL